MEDVVRIGLPLGECVGLQHRQSWLRIPPNTDEEVHSCWANFMVIPLLLLFYMLKEYKRNKVGITVARLTSMCHESAATVLSYCSNDAAEPLGLV